MATKPNKISYSETTDAKDLFCIFNDIGTMWNRGIFYFKNASTIEMSYGVSSSSTMSKIMITDVIGIK